MDLDELLKSIREEGNPNKGGSIVPAKFFGEDRYAKYLEEITSQGTLGGEQLTPSERKEAFKKRNDKIGFESFVNKVLSKKQSAVFSKPKQNVLTGGGALVKSPGGGLANVIKPPVSEETQDNLDDILKGIDSILETLKAEQKLEEKTAKEEKRKQETEKRSKKEGLLESKAFKGIAKVAKKILAPVKSLFDKLIDSLLTIVTGRIVIELFDWFTDKENKGKVETIFRFIKDWWPTLLGGLILFGGALLGPVGLIAGITALSIAFIPKLIDATKQLLGFGKQTEDDAKKLEKQQGISPETEKPLSPNKPEDFKNLPEPGQEPQKFADGGEVRGQKGVDKVPAMLTDGEFVMSKGAVDKFGIDTLASMNAMGGGTNRPMLRGGSMFANGGGYVEKNEKLSPQLKNQMKERSGDEKVSGGGGRKWWDFLGWAGTGKKKEETSTKGVEGGTGLTDIQKQALGILAKYESGAAGYNAVNQIGTADGRGVKKGSFSGDIRKMSQHKGRPLTDFTIAEIKALQFDDRSMSDDQWIKAGKLHAVGKYQFIGNTLPGVAKRAGIPDNAKFSEGAQDLMALQLMKERGISPWVGPSDKATAAERAIIAQARGQDIKFDPSMPTGSMIAAAPSMQPGGSAPSAPSAPPTPKTSLANLQKAIDFKPAKSAPSIGLPVQRMNANIDALRAAIDGASAPQTSSTSKALNNEIPNISAAIMQSPSKVKTLGVVG